MKKRIRVFMIAMSVFCALLLTLNIVTLVQLAQTNAALERVRSVTDGLFGSITGTLGNDISVISGISAAVSAALKQESAVFSTASCEPGAFDKLTRTAHVTLHATPKRYVDGMAVSFVLTDESGNRYAVQGVKDTDSYGFTATLALPPVGRDLSFSAAATIDGATLTEQLDSLYDFMDGFRLHPEPANFSGSYGTNNQKSSLFFDGTVDLSVYGNPAVTVTSLLLRVEKNGQPLADLPFEPTNDRAAQDERATPAYAANTSGESRLYNLVWQADYPDFNAGDRLTATILMEDSNGFHYAYVLKDLRFGETGSPDDLSTTADFVIS